MCKTCYDNNLLAHTETIAENVKQCQYIQNICEMNVLVESDQIVTLTMRELMRLGSSCFSFWLSGFGLRVAT